MAEFVEFRGFKGITRVAVKPSNEGTAAGPTVPVVDCAGVFSDDLSHRQSVADSVRDALHSCGTLYAANHGIPQAVQEQVRGQGQAFFGKDLDEKMEYHQSRSTSGKRGYNYLAEGRDDEPGRHGM